MTTVADAEPEQWRKQAKQAVERFVRRFDESYRLLAYHAALPLVLTPELVNYLRNEFLRDKQVPWVAEVDLLLSDLCSQVGYELYAMETHVRAYLLEQMKQDPRFGERRMQEVARVLISYVSYLSRSNPGRRQQELEAQRWAAMVYLGDEQCKAAAREIAKRLIETSSGTGSENLSESGIRAELARLTRITEELSPQLRQEPSLLEYARLMQRLLKTPDEVSSAELQHSYQIDDLELTFPAMFVPKPLTQSVQSSQQIVTSFEDFLPIQTFEFEMATITIETETETSPEIQLKPFEFEVATIELQQTGWIRKKTELVVQRHQRQAWSFIEDLGNEVELEMVAIPEGEFVMGSPEDEFERFSSESPQHTVTIQSFFMGKYAVTQAQWKVIASLPQINRELNPEPSGFKGANRPVETVSWLDAVEFCERLSRKTGRQYRLPSEAEWEYACRAGTTTPFHFGETITTDLANYDGRLTYGAGSKGINRQETTEVGSFGVANAFGLYDMHGNVWEWCADQWHENYQGAPTDGRKWLDNNDNDNQRYVLRGGSWDCDPRNCRSAYRNRFVADFTYHVNGFRVACAAARTL